MSIDEWKFEIVLPRYDDNYNLISYKVKYKEIRGYITNKIKHSLKSIYLQETY